MVQQRLRPRFPEPGQLLEYAVPKGIPGGRIADEAGRQQRGEARDQQQRISLD